jgi:hypothetical protein
MIEHDSSDAAKGPLVTPLLDVATDGLHLVQQDIALARQETIEKITPAVRSVGMILVGGVLALVGSVYLLQSIVRMLATRIPLWFASLLSGVAFALAGALLMGRGRQQLKHLSLVPRKTINSLKEDKEWLLHQIKSRLI